MTEKEALDINSRDDSSNFLQAKAIGYLEAIEKAKVLEKALEKLLQGGSTHLSELNAYWCYSDTLHFELEQVIAKFEEEK